MIVFKTIRWKNFLSTGNSWTEIPLNKSKSTLIVGQNGAGKSTMLDALSFALFGKPHRNINKPQLVNSVNQKDCLVEVIFSIGKTDFKIVRGIKPQVFEIWRNGILLNQVSTSKEYQMILEQNILKLNHKSFHQIVVLGSSSFIPFMQLPAQHRRDVIEDLLDINIFSKMNVLLKERNITLKDSIKDIQYRIEITKNRIESQKKYIRDITQINENEIQSKRESISNLQTEIESLQEQNLTCSNYVEKNQEIVEAGLKKAHDKKQSLLHYNIQFNQSIREIVKESKFYEENSSCPTCTQPIAEDLRSKKLSHNKSKARELQSAIKKTEDEGSKIEDVITHYNTIFEEIRKNQNSIHVNNQSISRLQKQILELNSEIERLSNRNGDTGTAKQDLTKMETERDQLLESRLEKNEELVYNNAMTEMLKDTGIKTKVIKQYIPVINKLVNQYLQVLDFFVHFHLDESFQESIRSRHRDLFTYDSFSEGEKQRIDLALLFTWRMIAKMKNSVSTNLLVLDETFDSSLDHEGVDNLMKILYTLDDDTNIFVISHKGEILDGKFKEKIEFIKERNFSKMAA
jgi:DNA repair exonuclease SbcCD ATPase subunit